MVKNQSELAAMLNAVYPTREYKWQGGANIADMPYIVYRMSDTDNFAADNKVYVKRRLYEIDLYFPVASFVPEETLEAAFEANEIYWNATRAKASDMTLGEFSDIELYDTSGGDFYITTYRIEI